MSSGEWRGDGDARSCPLLPQGLTAALVVPVPTPPPPPPKQPPTPREEDAVETDEEERRSPGTPSLEQDEDGEGMTWAVGMEPALPLGPLPLLRKGWKVSVVLELE